MIFDNYFILYYYILISSYCRITSSFSILICQLISLFALLCHLHDYFSPSEFFFLFLFNFLWCSIITVRELTQRSLISYVSFHISIITARKTNYRSKYLMKNTRSSSELLAHSAMVSMLMIPQSESTYLVDFDLHLLVSF